MEDEIQRELLTWELPMEGKVLKENFEGEKGAS